MKLFYYYTEDIANKAIIKNEVSVDEKTLESLSNVIDFKKSHYDYEYYSSSEYRNKSEYD